MNTSNLFALLCALSSVACDVSCFGECDDWDDCSDQHHHHGGGANAGGASTGDGASAGTGAGGDESQGGANSGDAGGTANAAGRGGAPNSEPKPCASESECSRGFNCDHERAVCIPADAETCPELSSESACDNRKDCMSVYAGINCSCGADCACVGGEPGCVCQSFAFYTCEPLKD